MKRIPSISLEKSRLGFALVRWLLKVLFVLKAVLILYCLAIRLIFSDVLGTQGIKIVVTGDFSAFALFQSFFFLKSLKAFFIMGSGNPLSLTVEFGYFRMVGAAYFSALLKRHFSIHIFTLLG